MKCIIITIVFSLKFILCAGQGAYGGVEVKKGIYTNATTKKSATLILELLDSNKFEFIYKPANLHLLQYKTKGDYYSDGVRVILNTGSAIKSVNGITEEQFDSSIKKGCILRFKKYSGELFKNLKVLVNGNQVSFTDSLGQIKTNFMPETIYTDFYLDYNFYYTLVSDKSNLFTFTLVPYDNSQLFLHNKTFLIKGQFLVGGAKEKLVRKAINTKAAIK